MSANLFVSKETKNLRKEMAACQDLINDNRYDCFKDWNFNFENFGDDKNHLYWTNIYGIFEPERIDEIYIERSFQTANSETDGINLFKLAFQSKSNGLFIPDDPSVENLFTAISRKRNDQEAHFNDKAVSSTTFSYFVGIFGLFVIVIVGNYLYNQMSDNLGCLFDDSDGCSSSDLTNRFLWLLNISILFSCCILFYNLTIVGFYLAGAQSFAGRSKLSTFLDNANFRGKSGKFGFLTIVMFMFLVGSYYKKDGKMIDMFDFVELIKFPFDNKLEGDDVWVQTFINSKMMLIYMFFYAALFIIGSCIEHPFTKMLFDSLESKKKASDPKEDVGKLSKLAIFILTINTILICLCLALFLKSTLNMINWDASGISFDVQKSQLHIAMYLFTLLIGYKYAFATISRRENSNISWFFMVYTPFIVFAVSVCGLENSQNELIQNILFYLLISIWLINFLYLHISQFFQTIKMEIEFLLEMIVDRRMHSFFLSLCYCVCLMMAFVNIITVYSENWFVFEYKFCQGTTNKGLTMLPKLSRIAPEKLLLNVQNILSIITLFTIFFGIIFAVFERKYINFRKLHFWISFMLCAVNCCVFQGLVFLKDILDNMEANGFANIVYVKANLENYESCCIMLIIALVADVIACLHSPACYNVTYKPVRNPDFTALPQKEVVSKELVDIVCINKEIRRLQKKDQHFKSSFIPLFIYFLFYIAIMVYLFNKAHSEDWLNIVINNNNHYDKMDDLNLSETTCDRDYSEYPLIVEPFRQILIETANSAVSSVELVDDSVKSTVLLGFPLVAILTLITFISHVFVPEMVPLLPVIAGLNIFVLPLSVFVLFAPIVAKAGSISLVGEVRIEEGMHAAMELFFLQIVYLILLATNAFPVAELQVTEEEVKEVAAEEAMSLI